MVLKPFARQLFVSMDEGPALILLAVEDEVDMVVHKAEGQEDQIRDGKGGGLFQRKRGLGLIWRLEGKCVYLRDNR